MSPEPSRGRDRAARLSRRRFLDGPLAASGAATLGISRAPAAASPHRGLDTVNWQALRAQVGSRLIQARWPLAACMANRAGAATLKSLQNPCFLEGEPGAT